MAQYIVKQAHWAERDGARHRFAPGEVREAEPGEVQTALKFGHLAPYLPQLDHDGDGAPGGSVKKTLRGGASAQTASPQPGDGEG